MLDTSDTAMVILQNVLCPNVIPSLVEKATSQYNKQLVMVIVIQCPVKEVITEREDEYVDFSEELINKLRCER